MAISILMIGLVSVLSATAQMHSLRQSNRDTALAQNALRSMAERMHATSYGFSADPATWAENVLATFGTDGSRGAAFTVEGLTPVAADAQGTIEILTDERKTDAELAVELGMPRDLNGDGDAADGDVSGAARILPVILTLRWRGENGVRTLRHPLYLLGY